MLKPQKHTHLTIPNYEYPLTRTSCSVPNTKCHTVNENNETGESNEIHDDDAADATYNSIRFAIPHQPIRGKRLV